MNEKIVAYYNGDEILLDELHIPAIDRAYMFGDAVYEVLRVYKGRAFLQHEHMARLERSLRSMRIPFSKNIDELILRNIEVNKVTEGMVYIQISRGAAHRNHSFYDLTLTPNILIYTKPFFIHPAKEDQIKGLTVITHEDLRWSRCDIKTVNLLANCLIQTHAHEQGADDAILIRDGMVTECTSANVFLVKDDTFVTPPLSNFILPGIRRKFFIELLQAASKNVIERTIDKAEIATADEIFMTSTIKECVPVIKVDSRPVGTGFIGAQTKLALELFNSQI